MKTVRQILAIACIELRFGLRRGGPVVVTVLIGLILGAGTLLAPLSNLGEYSSNVNNMTPEQVEKWTSFGFTLEEHAPFIRDAIGDMFVLGSTMAWILAYLALVFLPVATAATIPADRKFGASELLRSTPITGARYLLGKVLGVFATVLLVGLIMLLLFFAFSEAILFSFLRFGLSLAAFKFFIELALLDGLPLLFLGSAIGVLIGVIFRTRRGAIFPGFLAGLLSSFAWAYAFRTPRSALPMTDIAEYYVVQNYRSASLAIESKALGQEISLLGEKASRLGFGHVLMMYLLILLAFSALAMLAHLWLKWKENF